MNASVNALPAAYNKHFEIDLMHNKKQAIYVNLLSLLIGVLGIGIYLMILKLTPVELVFEFDPESIWTVEIMFVIFILSFFVYLILHELVHGMVFKYYSDQKLKFGFTLLYAFAAIPNAYFYKKAYIKIGLAPLVVFSILFVIPLFFTNDWLFLYFFSLFIVHIAGCIGDIYVAIKLKSYADDTLINDEGTRMTFYVVDNK